MIIFPQALLLSVLAVATIAAKAPISKGPAIYFHPKGCSSGKGVVTLVSPGSLAVGEGHCTHKDNAFPKGNASGGYQVSLPPGISLEIKQGPSDGLVCGPELIGQYTDTGCYDLPALGNRVWWNFCRTGLDCLNSIDSRSYPPPPTRALKRVVSSGILKDDDGEYLLSSKGTRIPVVYKPTIVLPPAPEQGLDHRLSKRQANTFSPPKSCFIDTQTCKNLGSSGSLRATCVNCVNGLGSGVKASKSMDCRNSGSACSVTYTKSITITASIDFSLTAGITIGDSGRDGVGGHADFGFGVSFSIATTHAEADGISIPVGKKGYVQYQPPAVLGTVVLSSTRGHFCDSLGLNKICQSAPGILATSKNDADGQYSVVLTS